jgi:polyhydroxyalkanoate synthesis regulator phasin
MTEVSENIIINHLEHIRGKVDEIGEQVRGVEGRMSSIEIDFVRLAKNEAGRDLDLHAIAQRVDRLESRLAKLERADAREKAGD